MKALLQVAVLVGLAAFLWQERALIERGLRETGILAGSAPPDPAAGLPDASTLSTPAGAPRRAAPGKGRTARRFSAVRNDTPIPLGREMRVSPETATLEPETPAFYETVRGRGTLAFLGIAAFFGFLAWALTGLKKKSGG